MNPNETIEEYEARLAAELAQIETGYQTWVQKELGIVDDSAELASELRNTETVGDRLFR